MDYEKTIIWKHINGNYYHSKCKNCKEKITLFKFEIIVLKTYIIVCINCYEMLNTLQY